MSDLDDQTGEEREPSANAAAWWLAILLGVFYALGQIDRTIVVHLVEMIKRDLSVTDFQMSLFLGPAFGVVYAVCAIPAGWATDRFERRWILFLGVIVWSLATMLSAFAQTFLQMVVIRMVVAAGEATLLPAAVSILSDRFPRNRLTTAISVVNMGPKAGGSLAFVFAGVGIAAAGVLTAGTWPVVSAMETWQLVMLMIGAPGLLVGFLIFTVREPARRKPTGEVAGTVDGGSFIAFLKERRAVFIPLFLGIGILATVGQGQSNWAPAFLNRAYGWTAVQYGPWMGLASILGSLAMLPKGMIVDWLYGRGLRDAPLRLYTWILIGLLPCGVFAFFSPSPGLFIATYGLIFTLAMTYQVFSLAALRQVTPSRFVGRMTGVFLFVIPLVSQGLGPPAVAGMTDFVFHDPQKLGLALGIITSAGMVAGIVLLRVTLKTMRRSLDEIDDERAGPKPSA